jgi:hypothetical protein
MGSVRSHGVARRVAVWIVAGGLGTAGAVFGVAAVPAHAATPHRAAVVVEVDGVIHTAKISFAADSITGLDALRSVGFNPHVRVFGGNGGAVCALDIATTTIGCPADTTCLTCAQPAYWAYFRALSGATSYTYSVIGAGNSLVHDGDVEAWAWGTGSPPSPFTSFTDVWGSDPTTTRSPTTHAPSTSPTVPASTPGTIGGLGATTTSATSVPPPGPTTTAGRGTKATTTTRPGSRASTTTEGAGVRGSETTGGTRKIATAPVVAHGGGGSPVGLVSFVVILAALVGAIVFARRRRRTLAQP